MFRIIIIFLFCAIFSINAAEPYIISGRTGNEINSKERDYFGLFPDIKGFKNAVFTTDGNNSVYVDIMADNNSVVTMNASEAKELGAYINNFENVNCWNSKDIINLDYDLFSKFIRDGNHFINPQHSTVQTFDGRIVSSKIIYADSSWIIVWKGKDFYNPENTQEQAEIFHYSQVQAIFIGEWVYFDGTLSDYIDILPILWERDYARGKSFENNIPPELWEPFDKVRSKLKDVKTEISVNKEKFEYESGRVYNFTISYNIEAVRLIFSELYYKYKDEVPGGGSFCGTFTEVAAVQNLSIGISRQIYGRWRGKLEFIYYPDRTSSFDRTLLISGYSVSPEIEFVAFRYIPGVPSGTEGLEITLHAGIEFMNITNNSVIPYLDGFSGLDCNHDAKRLEGSADADLMAYRFGAHIDLFLSDNISFFVNSEVDVCEEIELKPMETGKGSYEYIGDEYEIMPLKFGVGLKWHL